MESVCESVIKQGVWDPQHDGHELSIHPCVFPHVAPWLQAHYVCIDRCVCFVWGLLAVLISFGASLPYFACPDPDPATVGCGLGLNRGNEARGGAGGRGAANRSDGVANAMRALAAIPAVREDMSKTTMVSSQVRAAADEEVTMVSVSVEKPGEAGGDPEGSEAVAPGLEWEAKVRVTTRSQWNTRGALWSPRFPKAVEVGWWLVLGMDNGELLALKRVGALQRRTNEIALKFPRVEEGAGETSLVLHVVADGVMGIDVQDRFTVNRA